MVVETKKFRFTKSVINSPLETFSRYRYCHPKTKYCTHVYEQRRSIIPIYCDFLMDQSLLVYGASSALAGVVVFVSTLNFL